MMLCIIGLGLGITRALFKYVKEGLNQQIIAGDIYMKEIEGEKVVSNIKPMDVEEGKTNGEKYKFKVEGYNTSKKDIYYGIYLNHGEEVEEKERFNRNEGWSNKRSIWTRKIKRL